MSGKQGRALELLPFASKDPATCNAASNIATFTPAANPAASALFTATVTTGARDLAGNPLAANKVWTFTTGTATVGQAPVNLRSLSTFAAVAGAGLTNSHFCGQALPHGAVRSRPPTTTPRGGSPLTPAPSNINRDLC